jgi:hypothetical protein
MTTGCAYRLPPFVPPTQERIRIVADAPEQYVVRVNMDTITNYNVPRDGRVAIGVPAYRTCGVYLFGIVKVRSENEPFPSWSISVTRGGVIVRKVSLRKLTELAMDPSGYHMLKVMR